jgi:hypothetical protein
MYTASTLIRLQELGHKSVTVASKQTCGQKRKAIHKKGNNFVRIKVLTAMIMKSSIFRVI